MLSSEYFRYLVGLDGAKSVRKEKKKKKKILNRVKFPF